MYYEEVKAKLEDSKYELMKKMKIPTLSKEEMEALRNKVQNYDYIIELTDMNHFGRGQDFYPRFTSIL
jgi:hypothetical protein